MCSRGNRIPQTNVGWSSRQDDLTANEWWAHGITCNAWMRLWPGDSLTPLDDQLAAPAPPSAGQPVTLSERQRLLTPPGEAILLTAVVLCSPLLHVLKSAGRKGAKWIWAEARPRQSSLFCHIPPSRVKRSETYLGCPEQTRVFQKFADRCVGAWTHSSCRRSSDAVQLRAVSKKTFSWIAALPVKVWGHVGDRDMGGSKVHPSWWHHWACCPVRQCGVRYEARNTETSSWTPEELRQILSSLPKHRPSVVEIKSDVTQRCTCRRPRLFMLINMNYVTAHPVFIMFYTAFWLSFFFFLEPRL